jgi:hypothetical protein
MKIPSLTFLIIYVSLIPIFGLIYNSFPNEFYHSTNKYEEYVEIDKNEIMTELQQFLRINLQKSHGKQIFVRDTIFFDINTIEISDFSIDKNEATFRLFGSFLDKELTPRSGSGAYFNIILFNHRDSTPDTLETGELTKSYPVCSLKKNPDFELKADELFNIGKLKINSGSDWASYYTGRGPDYACSSYPIPISITDKIDAYSSALRGFPSYSSGNFHRMLYFSAMTITSVGPGDIVPISTRARYFVALEPILGIIISGLFLNSLANRIKAK